MRYFFLLFFLLGCTQQNISKKTINFDDEMSFLEFKLLLIEYNKVTDYPNLNE